MWKENLRMLEKKKIKPAACTGNIQPTRATLLSSLVSLRLYLSQRTVRYRSVWKHNNKQLTTTHLCLVVQIDSYNHGSGLRMIYIYSNTAAFRGCTAKTTKDSLNLLFLYAGTQNRQPDGSLLASCMSSWRTSIRSKSQRYNENEH